MISNTPIILPLAVVISSSLACLMDRAINSVSRAGLPGPNLEPLGPESQYAWAKCRSKIARAEGRINLGAVYADRVHRIRQETSVPSLWPLNKQMYCFSVSGGLPPSRPPGLGGCRPPKPPRGVWGAGAPKERKPILDTGQRTATLRSVSHVTQMLQAPRQRGRRETSHSVGKQSSTIKPKDTTRIFHWPVYGGATNGERPESDRKS